MQKPLIIGICGRSSSGKSSVCDNIVRLYPDSVVHLKADKFMKKEPFEFIDGYPNFETPNSIMFDKLIESIELLRNNKKTIIPSRTSTEVFDFEIFPKKIVLVDGFLIFANPSLVKLFDKKIFVDISDVTLKKRRLERKRFIDDDFFVDNIVIKHSKIYEQIQKSSADLIVDGEKSIDEVTKEIISFLPISF